MNTGLDQYMDIFKDAVEDSAAKLTKSFEKILIEVIILFMVIPRKINFTQMGRYGSHVEQTYRNAFGLKKSKSIDWLKLNVSLAKRFFGKQGRWAIAIDPSYISKAGKKTPHIGRFWSGCAQSVKHGLEIMGIGLIDIDAKDCMMLKAHQSLSNKELSLRNKTMVDFYIGVIKRYRKELLKLSTLIVADAYFSTSTFVNGIKKEGFSLISRFRDAKGYTGLMDCQARDKWKLDFAFNASFTSLNVAKVTMKEMGMEYSMSSFKSLMTNIYLVKRIFKASGYTPNRTLISKIFKDLSCLQRTAA
ncbi:transposase [Segatella copri]|uniref:transposase n=1 Tax=Segatella copri TaxID=165179 RepID=UPI0034E57DA0